MKLIVDIPEESYKLLQGNNGVDWLDVEHILTAVAEGTPLEAQSNRCDSCTHSEEQDGSNCYECVKGMADNFEAQPMEMRDATEEERKSTQDYIRSISKPTGIKFDEVIEELDFVQEHPKVWDDKGNYPGDVYFRKGGI